MVVASSWPKQFPVIDAHHHVWDVAARPQPWLDSAAELAPLRRAFGIADLSPLAASAGVAGTVVVQTVSDLAETRELLELTRTERLVAAVVGWADLTAPDIADVLARLRAGPGGTALAGIRHPLLTEPDPAWLLRPEVGRGLAAAAAAGLTFDLVLRPELLPVASRVAASLPAVTFILDHLGNVEPRPVVDAAWAARLREFASLPNTAAKLSGILGDVVRVGERADIAASAARLRPYVGLAFESFGPRRLMFGSDWPVCTLSASYAEVAAVGLELVAGLSEAEQSAILGGTASRVYQIGRG